jgi:hypothetical protein
MKKGFLAYLLLLSVCAGAQEVVPQSPASDASVEPLLLKANGSFEKRTSILSISFGFSDWNKQNFEMPDSAAFGSGSVSLPIYFRAERAISSHVGIAVSLAYDVFYYNYSKQEYNHGSIFYRPQNDKVRIISPGLELYYHFNKFIHNANWDVFVGVGAHANFVNHTNYPSKDSLSNTTPVDMAPFAKLGARYYINRNASFFGDVGYDKMSLISLGFSYRLYGRVLSL